MNQHPNIIPVVQNGQPTLKRPVDTLNPQPWYKVGEHYEREFIELVCPLLGIEAVINPDKKKNPKVPDLLVNGKLADLKTQVNVFYMTQKLAGIPPRFAVMLNLKDVNHYRNHYPGIEIYFWVQHSKGTQNLGGDIYSVEKPLFGVWLTSIEQVQELVTQGAYLHIYQKRLGTANAKASYIFDVRGFNELARF